jgi:hypothetical protein
VSATPLLSRRLISNLRLRPANNFTAVAEDMNAQSKTDQLELSIIYSIDPLLLGQLVAYSGDTPQAAAAKLGGTKPALALAYVEACLLLHGRTFAMMAEGASSYDWKNLEALGVLINRLSRMETDLVNAGVTDYAGKYRNVEANTTENAASLIQTVMGYLSAAGVTPDLIQDDSLEAALRIRQIFIKSYGIADDNTRFVSTPVTRISEIFIALQPDIDRALTQGLNKDPGIQPKLLRALSDIVALDRTAQRTIEVLPKPAPAAAASPAPNQ